MKGIASINGKDMWEHWKVRFERGAYEALLTPAALKPHLENSSRNMDGTEVLVHNPKLQERDVSFVITIHGGDPEVIRKEKEELNVGDPNKEPDLTYLTSFQRFVEEIQSNKIVLSVPALRRDFHLIYESCTKFGNYGLKYGKFSLRFREPNPALK